MKTYILGVFNAAVLAAAMLCAPTVADDISDEEVRESMPDLSFADIGALRIAAELGDAESQFFLGVAYFYGNGVAKDPRKGVRWFRKAAEQGNLQAQTVLGGAYWEGRGVIEDKREAVRWLRKPAEQGEPFAQELLAVAYSKGQGVIQDKRESVRWYRKAAEQGNVPSQHDLGLAYLRGEGVIEDEREAYIWLSIAKASGSESAVEIVREFNRHTHLSQDEIRSAKKEARKRLEEIDRRVAQREAQQEQSE